MNILFIVCEKSAIDGYWHFMGALPFEPDAIQLAKRSECETFIMYWTY